MENPIILNHLSRCAPSLVSSIICLLVCIHIHTHEKKMNQIKIFSIVKNVINFHKGLQVARVTSLRIACKLYMVWESIICLLVCSIHTYGKLDQGHLGMLDP